MNTIEIQDRKIKTQYASCWEELTDEQFAHVMQNWLKVVDGYLNQHEYKLIVLYKLLGIQRGPFDAAKDKRLSPQKLEMKYENLWRLTETIEWLFEYRTDYGRKTVALSYTGITNRLPEIETPEALLIGPADGCTNITFGEYRHAWMYFEAYITSREDAELDNLVATLYRPEREDYIKLKRAPGFDGNQREAFNPNLTGDYAKLLAEVPFWQKYTVLLWFLNCDRWQKEDEIMLAGKPVCFAQLFKRERDTEEFETLDETDLGLTQLLFMVAESNLFGGPDQVDRTSYIDILTALLYWKKQTDKIRRL